MTRPKYLSSGVRMHRALASLRRALDRIDGQLDVCKAQGDLTEWAGLVSLKRIDEARDRLGRLFDKLNQVAAEAEEKSGG